MRTPTFSIILPTYNREELLKRAVKSVLKQDFKNWELIIVNDGSKDNTKKDYRLWADCRIKHYNIKHKGISNAKNFGLKKAQGKFITFIDSDDYYHETHLKKHLDVIKKNNSVDLFYGGAKILGDNLLPDADLPGKKIIAEKCTLGGTFFIKKNVIQKVGGFPEVNFAEDHELYKIIKRAGFKVKKLNIKTYFYDRTHNGEITKLH